MKLTKQYLTTLVIVGLLATLGITYATMGQETYQPSRLSTGNLELGLDHGVGYKVPYGAISWAGYKLQTNLPNWGTRECLDLGPEMFYPSPSFATRQTAFGEYSERGPRNHTTTAKWALRTIAKLHPQYFAEFGRGRAHGTEPTEYEALYVAYCDPEVILAAKTYSAVNTEFSTPDNHPWWRNGWKAESWLRMRRDAMKQTPYTKEPVLNDIGAELILSQTYRRVITGVWKVPTTKAGVKDLFGGSIEQFCRLYRANPPRGMDDDLKGACGG